MTTLTVKTSRHCEMIDVTDRVARVVADSGVAAGTTTVFVPHTTAGVTINENADPSVRHDILLTLSDLIPKDRPGYRHAEGNSDSHTKASIVGFAQTVLIDNGRLVLGTWQGIYFCEFDGPRTRTMIVKVTGD